MVRLLEGWAPWSGGTVKVVVTARAHWPGLSPDAVLAESDTPTRYRNQPDPVVFFDADAYSDQPESDR